MVLNQDVEISVVIPCLDEEAGVGKVVDRAWQGIEATGRSGEVIVVDNGSSDRSAEIAEEAGARVVSENRRGYGSAYLAGISAARGDYIVMGDADETYDLRELGRLVGALRDADLVLGSRFRGRIHRGAMPWAHRVIGNPMLTRLLNLLFGTRLSDTLCGLRAIRRSAVRTLGLNSLGMEFAHEMVIKAAKKKLRIAEVPIDYYPRAGDSKLNTFRDGWRYLRYMLVHAPTFLFLVPGTIVFVAGLAALLVLASGPAEIFGRVWQVHAMIVASAATLVGAQVVQMGIFARSYAFLYGGERDPLVARFSRWLRLEHGLLLGALLFLAGGGLLLAIIVEWARADFGSLEREHPALLGLTLVGLGIQAIFASFFLSLLALPKETLIEERGGSDYRQREVTGPEEKIRVGAEGRGADRRARR